MTDEITLTLPRERPFFRIAHLVLGGLAVRLDVTLEHLEDLQLALAGVLDRHDSPEDPDVIVRVRFEDGVLHTRVGPFDRERLRADLDVAHAGELGLRRLLDTVVDAVSIEEHPEGGFVDLVKSVTPRAGG